MKKYLFLAMLLTLCAFSSCVNDKDDDESKQTFEALINNRAIDGDNVIFSQGKAKVEVNFTKKTLQMAADFKDISGISRNLNTSEMKMTLESGTVYSFSGTANGYFDMSTGMMWYTVDAGDGSQVYCTTQLIYPYLTTTVTNEDGGSFSHTQSGYIIAFDSKGQTAAMQITNYVPDTGGSIQATLLEYSGLTVTPTVWGYKITADEAECVQSSYYNISDLDITLSSNCWLISGSYKIKNHIYTLSGKLYGNSINPY